MFVIFLPSPSKIIMGVAVVVNFKNPLVSNYKNKRVTISKHNLHTYSTMKLYVTSSTYNFKLKVFALEYRVKR